MTANSQAIPTDGLPTQSYDQTTNRINTAGYEYDPAGNLIRGQGGDGTWQRYLYDAAGRLTIIRNDAGIDMLYNGYTSSRQRLFTNDSVLGLSWYVWGGSQVIAEYKSNTWGSDPLVWKKSYIYAGSRLLSTFTKNSSNGETLEFHHPDRLGTKLVTNNTANTSFTQSTLPFGTSLDAETTGTTNQRFTSYDRSTVAQLDYAVNRSYSAGQGRFTSPDPIGMSAASLSDPQSLNMYAYSGNEPINFTDSVGLNESMCSAEYSYGQCGGDGGFWGNSGTSYNGSSGGGFGGGVAYNNQTLGALPPHLQSAVDQHLQRISNSQAGNGFNTNAELNAIYGGILAIVNVGRNANGSLNFGSKNFTQLNLASKIEGRGILDGAGKSPILNLADKILNPDGLTVSFTIPGFTLGGSITLTKNFDVFLTGSGGMEGKGLWEQLKSPSIKNLKPSITVQGSWILTTENSSRDSRFSFYDGDSTSGGLCFGICLGGTRVGDGRKSINIGIGMPPGVGGGFSADRSFFLGNPHRWLFGPTTQNGGIK